MEKQIKFKLLGMDTDSDVSVVDGTSSLENYNIRFTVTEDGQRNAAISNEKGTKVIPEINLSSTIPIGYCTISDFLVIFETTSMGVSDFITIYKFEDNTFTKYYSYFGAFNFKIDSPIECQTVWEREDILKVFWIDGRNPLRYITIPRTSSNTPEKVTSNYFDVVREINLSNIEASIDVSKQTSGGTFPVGTIQYAFTYYNKYGSESSIFKITPLFYLSNSSSGAPSDRSVSCSFRIKVSNVDSNWEYLRVYSILRTAVNGTPVCKRVIDINIENFPEKGITWIDNGQLGETIDSTRLLYVGGERIVPNTMAQKDGTLFLGNYKIIRPEIDKDIKEEIRKSVKDKKDEFFDTSYTEGSTKYARKLVSVFDTDSSLSSYYQYTPQLLSSQNKITTFKCGETYRIGIQLQDVTGRWSEPIFLFDTKNSKYPSTVLAAEAPGESELPNPDSSLNPDKPPTDFTHIDFPKWDKDMIISGGISDIPGSGGSSGGSSSGGSSDNNTVSSSDVKSAVKTLLSFGYLNLKLEKIKYKGTNVLDYIKGMGYVRIRPIIVYPNAGNREVLFQGVANPTIKKGIEQNDMINDSNLDYRMPSWFFRPVSGATKDIYHIGNSFTGVPPVYMGFIPYYDYKKLGKNAQAEFQCKTMDSFLIDWDVLTIDSPDIRFNEQLSITDLRDIKARVVGLVSISGNSASYSIEVDGSVEPTEEIKDDLISNNLPFGNKLKVPFRYLSGRIDSDNAGGCLINYPFWVDGFSDRGYAEFDPYFAQWYVFPWHRNGSLNNCSSTNMNNIEGAQRPSMLKRKVLANLRFGYKTIYGDITIGKDSTADFKVTHARVFNQNSANQIDRFPDGTIFKNSVDVVLPATGLTPFRAMGKFTYPEVDGKDDKTHLRYIYIPGNIYESDSYEMNLSGSDPRDVTTELMLADYFRIGTGEEEMRYYDPHHWSEKNGKDRSYHINTDPIPMQFKTGSNCIIQLNSFGSFYSNLEIDGETFTNVASAWLPIIELYREVQNKFGGESDDAIQQSAWLIAGKPVALTDDVKLFWDYGDTYFQRYDCLKTMPYSESSINNIVEILSFFCETNINIDGRYDTNRGLDDNTTVNTNNFNQLNDVYTQQDNYFQYYVSDYDLTQLNFYQNQILWSMTKNSGDLVDPWTNLTLLNYLDLDGTMGQIRAIKNFNGQLYVFQDKGIAGINYNQNVVLNTENGVPIEIANSGKVTGSVYLSTSQGCLNKWAIANIGQGLVFLDSLNKQLNIFDGKQIVNLGEKAKFQSWINKNCGSTDKWNPLWYGINPNTITFLHDKSANEILLTSENFSVAYNLGLMKFTSFYSYEACPWLIDIDTRHMILGKDKENKWKLWDIRQGRPNEFFGKFYPYHIEFLVTDNQYFDYMKLFHTLEIRDTVPASDEDTYERDYRRYSIQKSFSFDTIKASDSYQDSGNTDLKFKRGTPSNLKSKLRTWRIEVPRNENRGIGRVHDRIRDHYMKVKLSKQNESYNQIKVHDIIALYNM